MKLKRYCLLIYVTHSAHVKRLVQCYTSERVVKTATNGAEYMELVLRHRPKQTQLQGGVITFISPINGRYNNKKRRDFRPAAGWFALSVERYSVVIPILTAPSSKDFYQQFRRAAMILRKGRRRPFWLLPALGGSIQELNFRYRVNLKPAMLRIEHVYSGDFYMIAHVRQANLLFEILTGLLGTGLSDRVDADWFKD
jgi:hypothetical protein